MPDSSRAVPASPSEHTRAHPTAGARGAGRRPGATLPATAGGAKGRGARAIGAMRRGFSAYDPADADAPSFRAAQLEAILRFTPGAFLSTWPTSSSSSR